MQEKHELRKKARIIRNSLDMQTLSEQIVKNIQSLEVYQKAEHIMTFYPLEHEVNLLALLKDNKHFYLPKVDGEHLLICPYKEGDDLTISAYRTKEPLTKPVPPEILEIVFIPALMADRNLNRLGYGGGFYDRFLTKLNKNVTKIVTIPSALISNNLPFEDFDEKFDILVCEIM